MNKIALIIQREYLSRVRKKTFLVMTLLTPALVSLLFFIPFWLATDEENEQKVIAVIDQTGLYGGVLHDSENYIFEYENNMMSPAAKEGIYAFLLIHADLLKYPDSLSLYSQHFVTSNDKKVIKNQLEVYLRNEKLASFQIPNLDEILQSSAITLSISTIQIKENNDLQAGNSSDGMMFLSILSAFLIYMFIFIYGSQVMYSVLEEKSSRIIEIIISSVKPTQLMLGKIISAMLVALTQIACWIMLSVVCIFLIGLFSGEDVPAQGEWLQQMPLNDLLQFDFVGFFGWFLIYFLGGYLLYSSFFASIGAVIESGSDSQQFVLPVTIPLIFSLYVATYCFQHPDGELAFWCSLIPLSSPIVMIARLPFGVPTWQLLISVVLLVITFVFSTRIAARIYHTGILMYGKKASYKDMWKWLKNR
ncbi:MAG: ABC transporter permease [Bacteroidales bacterium]|nr:ABC transporter permease [Bacteroidales bacterium]